MIPSVDLIEPRRRRLTRWISAALLISALHLGGGSFAMRYWQEELIDELRGAIVVEIAPVATTLVTEMHDAPIGQLSEAREATQAASAAKIVRVEDATKEDLSAPLESAAALPKPTPAEEPKDEPKPETRREVRVAPEEVTASKATAPLRVDAHTSTKSAAPEVGTAAATSRSVLSWQNAVVLHLNKHKRPYVADRRIQGIVKVIFAMDRSGKLITSRVTHSSGFALLDEEALELLRRASPLPRPPVAVPGETLELSIPIRFRNE